MKRSAVIGFILVSGALFISLYFLSNRIWSPQTRSPTGAALWNEKAIRYGPLIIDVDHVGNLDTSAWVEYRSEYAGFSVRAPANGASIGCVGHGCDPRLDGDMFNLYTGYSENNEGPADPDFRIKAIQRYQGSTLESWVSNYVISGKDQIKSQHVIALNGLRALELNLESNPHKPMLQIKYANYPVGRYDEQSDNYSTIASVHRTSDSAFWIEVIELPDRYLIVDYAAGVGRYLNELHKTVLSSLSVFTPTSS